MLTRVKVNGGLGFLLKFSRILGISLISIAPATDGYFVKFSYSTAIYSYCCVILCSIIVVIALIIDIKLYENLPLAKLIDAGIVITFCMYICSNGVSRTKSMLEHLTSLNKIKKEICCLYPNSHSLAKRHLVFCLTLFIFWIIIYMLFFIKSILTAKDTADYFYLTLIYHYLQISMLETVVLMLKLKVYKALKILSGELRALLDIVKSGSNLNVDYFVVIARGSKQINIRNVVNAFIGICKVVNEMNEIDGGYILYLILITIFYIIFAISDMIAALKNSHDLFSIIYVLLWVFILLFRLYVIIDPCYFILKEAKEIEVLLSKMMCETTAVGMPYSWKWDLTLKQLYLIEPTFTPLGMFALDRFFITSIVSVVTTYIMIAVPHMQNIYAYMRFQ